MKTVRFLLFLCLAACVAAPAGAANRREPRPVEELRPLAEAGDAEAQCELGFRLASGEGLMTAVDNYEKYYWFPRLYKHEDFQDAVKEASRNRFRPCLEVILGLAEPGEDTVNLQSLTAYEEMLTAAAGMNFTRWRTFNDPKFPVKTGEDFHENIEFMRSFLTERMAYLDSIWLSSNE